MTLDLKKLYIGDDLSLLHSKIDAETLSTRINSESTKAEFTPPKLAVAANLSTADLFDKTSLDSIGKDKPEDDAESLSWSYAHWRSHIEKSLSTKTTKIDLDDLIFFVSTGLLSKQQSEVRNLLRTQEARSIVNNDWDATSVDSNWSATCKRQIARALLLLVRQTDQYDVIAANKAIQTLRETQASKKSEISKYAEESPSKTGFEIIGLYHLAHATARTAEYLATGKVSSESGRSLNFEPELKRLLVKAEEHIETAGSPESLLWCKAVGFCLWMIFDDSIWRRAHGISDTIDALLEELSSRDNPIFSLLPSQQDALKLHLLDSTQIAVVLQMPTSAGKTLLAEFSILQAFEAYKDNTRVLYIAPTKALCTQTYRTLASDLAGLNIPVQLASSAFEEDPFEAALISSLESGVVVSTPEKVDLFLRTHPEWFETLKLVVVDEAHLISDKERGVRLELLLANIRRERPTARFLLLTPFVDNAKKVANWLGGDRGAPINISWRPSRLMIGLASSSKKKEKLNFKIDWKEPHSGRTQPLPLNLSVDLPESWTSSQAKLIALNEKFSNLGLTLGMYPASRAQAEDAAIKISKQPSPIKNKESPELNFAIALAEAEYGNDSLLANCLREGTAFHHSALSPELRYLIEELGRTKQLRFLAATTTLAQGINFPVSTVLVHSVHKPRGGGDLSPSEFWNIAGRAGRVGLADKGLIVFTNSKHRTKWEQYTKHLSESIVSALLSVLSNALSEPSLKEAYRKYPQVRPFIQYIAHAAVTMTPTGALASLEEIIEASFANSISTSRDERRALRHLATKYLSEISRKSIGYLKVSDSTGFGSFSFDTIFASISNDPILNAGPKELINGGPDSLSHLVSMLAFLPELDLALGNGSGFIDVHAVARVIDGWMSGRTVEELSSEFDGDDANDRIRKAGTYVFSKVSQTISWGAHAYMRGWALQNHDASENAATVDMMLPAFIQHGVNTPEAAVASLFGVPRLIAEPLAEIFRKKNGKLTPENVSALRHFVESSDDSLWSSVLENSKLKNKVAPGEARLVWRKMRGLQ